jgi:uncharacterized phage protein (TIGR02220 family)
VKGWIRLYRKSLKNFLYREKRPLTKREAWENLLLTANYKSEEILMGNDLIKCDEGQIVKSLYEWALEFKWSVSSVNRFFKLLKKENMIELDNIKNTTRITILNYEIYQGERNIPETKLEQKWNGDNIINKEINNNNNKEKYKKEKKSTPEFRKEVIDYLNEKTGKNFKANSDKNIRTIEARCANGYGIEDFKKVIDIKTKEWLNNEKMEKFLRPETLFSNKFESYLNQKLIDRNNGKPNNKTGPIKIADLEASARDFEATYGTGSLGIPADG